jgi:hypothetical protein
MAYILTIQNSTGAPMTTIRDIGDSHIGGDDGGTWGVLISYGGQHMVGRYEGGGHLNVTFNKRLQAEVSGMALRRVHVSPLVAAGEHLGEHPASQ